MNNGMNTFASLVNTFTNSVLSAVGGLFVALGMVTFLYGMIEYILARRKGDEKGVENGNKFIVWGLIALFVMFSVYGIIKLGQEIFFGGRDVTSIFIPNIQLRQGTAKDVLGGGANVNFFGNQNPTVGSTIKSSNGANLGTVNSNNQVVDVMGNVVGKINNIGQVVDNFGGVIELEQRAIDTNYAGCPSGQYDDFGGCIRSSSSGGSELGVPVANSAYSSDTSGSCDAGGGRTGYYNENIGECMSSENIQPSSGDTYYGNNQSTDWGGSSPQEDKTTENRTDNNNSSGGQDDTPTLKALDVSCSLPSECESGRCDYDSTNTGTNKICVLACENDEIYDYETKSCVYPRDYNE